MGINHVVVRSARLLLTIYLPFSLLIMEVSAEFSGYSSSSENHYRDKGDLLPLFIVGFIFIFIALMIWSCSNDNDGEAMMMFEGQTRVVVQRVQSR